MKTKKVNILVAFTILVVLAIAFGGTTVFAEERTPTEDEVEYELYEGDKLIESFNSIEELNNFAGEKEIIINNSIQPFYVPDACTSNSHFFSDNWRIITNETMHERTYNGCNFYYNGERRCQCRETWQYAWIYQYTHIHN